MAIDCCPICQLTVWDSNIHNCPGVAKAALPPIGLKPRYIWEEQRFHEVAAAIHRYAEKGFTIPPEWIEEYNDLIQRR